jgi:hypothetical protein
MVTLPARDDRAHDDLQAPILEVLIGWALPALGAASHRDHPGAGELGRDARALSSRRERAVPPQNETVELTRLDELARQHEDAA